MAGPSGDALATDIVDVGETGGVGEADRTCDECRGTEGVQEAVIAGERMDLCRSCLPRLQAMDFFGGSSAPG